MAQSINEGKGNKVAATQGKITAQNPTNQSQEEGKLIGLFTVEDLNKLTARLTSQGFIRPRFVTTTFEMADRSLKSARMSQSYKNVIQMAFSLLADSIPPYRPKYKFCAYGATPSDIVEMINEGREAEAVESAEEEMGYILNDIINNMLAYNKDGYYDENIEEYIEKFEEYECLVIDGGQEFTENGKHYLSTMDKIRNAAKPKTHYVEVEGI